MRCSRRAVLAAVATAFGAALPARAAAADLRALMARARVSVLPVGLYNPLNSPRFAFRGSGFVVGDGQLLLTNVHVLPEASTTSLTPHLAAWLARADGSGGDARPLTLLRLDRRHDLALLRIEGDALPALTLAPSAAVAEGLEIALIGFPLGGVLGFSPVIHRGIVSSLTTIALPAPTSQQLDPRALARLREGAFAVYQLDATAYPGNSGGPLIDTATGQVIGIINMVWVRGSREAALSNPSGITYAIPARHAAELLEDKPR